jgi:hypothetical protein
LEKLAVASLRVKKLSAASETAHKTHTITDIFSLVEILWFNNKTCKVSPLSEV